MNQALPDYRQRLGGAIHETTPYIDHIARSRLKRVFPEGYFTPSRIGHVVIALTDEIPPDAYPFVPRFNTDDGIVLNIEKPQHTNICKEIIACGFGYKTEPLSGYIWENQSQELPPYTIALTSFKFITEPQVSAVTALTRGGGLLGDHDVFIGYKHGMRYKTYHCLKGGYSDYPSRKMPNAMQQDLYDQVRQNRVRLTSTDIDLQRR